MVSFCARTRGNEIMLQKKIDSKQTKKRMFFSVYLSCGTPCCRLAPKSLQGLKGMLTWIHRREKSIEGCLVFINILCPKKDFGL